MTTLKYEPRGLTVAKLRELLEAFDDDLPVHFVELAACYNLLVPIRTATISHMTYVSDVGMYSEGVNGEPVVVLTDL